MVKLPQLVSTVAVILSLAYSSCFGAISLTRIGGGFAAAVQPAATVPVFDPPFPPQAESARLATRAVASLARRRDLIEGQAYLGS
jgi:hypothetical protein